MADLELTTLLVRIATLEVKVAALQALVRGRLAAHEVRANERADLYERIERAIGEEFDFDVVDGQSLSPADILARLAASGEQISEYGLSEHARKVTLGKVLTRMGVKRGADSDGRLYALRVKG